jgi:hypothetical protein
MKRILFLALGAAALAGCAGPTGQPPPTPLPPATTTKPAPPQAQTPGLVREDVGGRPRLFSKVGFLMLDEPLRVKVLASFTEEGRLDHPKLRQNLKEARIAEGSSFVGVALPTGSFRIFLLRDGPWISLDPEYDAMVRRLAERVEAAN